jgi:hypothetical protein
MKSHLSILSLSCWAAGVLLRKSFLAYTYYFQTVSYTNIRVSDLILKSLIHFELILVQGDKHGSSFSFLQTDNHFSQQYLLKRLSFLHHIFLAPTMLRYFHSSPSFLSALSWNGVGYDQDFSASIEMIKWFLSLFLLMCCITFINLHMYLFGKNKVIAVWIHIRILSSDPLVFKSVFVPEPCWFYCYCFVI